MKVKLDLVDLQDRRYRLDFQKSIIEQNDLQRALQFIKHYSLDDVFTPFLEANGTDDMKILFSLPEESVRISTEADAVGACKGERHGFRCCIARVSGGTDGGYRDCLGWLSTDDSQERVFVFLSGKVEKFSSHDVELLWTFF